MLQLKGAENDHDIQVLFQMDEALDLLMATGYRNKAVKDLTLDDRSSVVTALLDYHLMAKVKAKMDQYKDGLSTLGFFDMMKQNSAIWEPFFVYTSNDVTAGT